ncbi:MAG: hypothetical protein ACRYHA_21745 [Janthinobacterium lividum]
MNSQTPVTATPAPRSPHAEGHSHSTLKTFPRFLAVVVGTFLLSFLILSLRNLEPLTYPLIVGEDSFWLGQMLNHHFLHTAFRGKDFPIVGTVMVQQLAVWLMYVLPGGLIRLPLALYIVANSFIATIASIAALSCRNYLPRLVRLCMWAAVVLMPMGIDGNVTFGRGLNLGFLFPVLQTLLLARMFADRNSRTAATAALIVSLIAGWTFPVATAITVAAAMLFMHRGPRNARLSNWRTWALLLVALISVLPMRMVSFSQGGAALPYVPAGFVEFALARSILFPVVAVVYSHLNDPVVIGLTMAVAFLAGIAWRDLSRTDSDRKRFTLFIVSSFVIYLLATLVMRKGLTFMVNGHYGIRYPDHYFYGVNILAVFTALALLAGNPKPTKWHTLIPAAWAALFFFQPLFYPSIFELAHPAISWRSHGTWKDELCATAAGKGALPIDWQKSVTTVATYPWEITSHAAIEIPTRMLRRVGASAACR